MYRIHIYYYYTLFYFFCIILSALVINTYEPDEEKAAIIVCQLTWRMRKSTHNAFCTTYLIVYTISLWTGCVCEGSSKYTANNGSHALCKLDNERINKIDEEQPDEREPTNQLFTAVHFVQSWNEIDYVFFKYFFFTSFYRQLSCLRRLLRWNGEYQKEQQRKKEKKRTSRYFWFEYFLSVCIYL